MTLSTGKLCIVLLGVLGAALIIAVIVLAPHVPAYHYDPQVAAGEWKVWVQVPPCQSAKSLQVVFPKEEGGPVVIECNAMPVGTR